MDVTGNVSKRFYSRYFFSLFIRNADVFLVEQKKKKNRVAFPTVFVTLTAYRCSPADCQMYRTDRAYTVIAASTRETLTPTRLSLRVEFGVNLKCGSRTRRTIGVFTFYFVPDEYRTITRHRRCSASLIRIKRNRTARPYSVTASFVVCKTKSGLHERTIV